MRIFLTGATGFIGAAIVPELIKAGHHVIGMTRSDAGEEALINAGAEVHRGTLEDPESLRSGAAKADGVIHTAFDHDFSRFVENCEKDKRAIAALGAALAGSDRPLIITSGTGMGSGGQGQLATEDVCNLSQPNPRIASELAANVLLEAGWPGGSRAITGTGRAMETTTPAEHFDVLIVGAGLSGIGAGYHLQQKC
ncbi:MAG: hypothetical protein QOG58_6246, partial [Caballeronia sp.]|nr:hypothetical protein [Caballeronia sp.]